MIGASIFGTALSIISTIIGGGIISIPYALTAPGFKTGILINFCAVIIMLFCGHLYLRARDIYKLQSFSELSYMSFGRKSVFMINLLIAFVIFGILTLYLILFSRITISLISPLLPDPTSDDDTT